MGTALWLVLVDLYHFAIGHEPTKPQDVFMPKVPESRTQPGLSMQISTPDRLLSKPILPALPAAVPQTNQVARHVPATGVHYVAQARVPLLRSAYQEFDGVVGYIRYGSTVTVESYSGQYARVLSSIGAGWLQKDVLVTERTHVFPVFAVGNEYLADNPTTQQVRLHINDAFNAAELVLPLQAVEYISYRLLTDNRTIPWPPERPRLPGSWQTILKGNPGIHIGIQPLSDSVMEYFDAEGEGVLAYVERVAPDNSLVCTAVGRSEAGVYDSVLLTEAQWRELRPVFIEVL